MLNADKTKLLIFEDFKVDYQLPKFKESKMKQVIDIAQAIRGPNQFEDSMELSVGSEEDFSSSLVIRSAAQWSKPSAWKRFTSWFARKPKPEPPPTMTVEEFFSHVKNTTAELVVIKEKAQGFERAIVNAQRGGQVAFVERLRAGLQAFRAEAQLVALGFPRYIEEKTLVGFATKSPRGLRLDWVKNFVRQIPEDVLAKKQRLDELAVFDNYVVLHYDPTQKAYAETAAEVAARKDPILFGVLRGRTNLYFVGDWVDEFCDLTLDQFAAVMGQEAVASLETLPDPYREAP